VGSSVDSQMSCLWPRLKFDRCSVAATYRYRYRYRYGDSDGD
jgi:hypothetical protein